MTKTRVALLILAGCGLILLPPMNAAPAPQGASVKAAQALAADTPGATVEGATFIAPAGWSISRPDRPPSSRRRKAIRTSRWWTCTPKTPTPRSPPPGPPTTRGEVAALVEDGVSDKDGWTDRRHTPTGPPRTRARCRRHGQRARRPALDVAIYDMSEAVAREARRGRSRSSSAGCSRRVTPGVVRRDERRTPLDAARVRRAQRVRRGGHETARRSRRRARARTGPEGGVRRRLRRARARASRRSPTPTRCS